jgi:4-hydroxybenzoate polyprenyltransferase
VKAWYVFVRERFSPVSHALLVTAFVSGNLTAARVLGRADITPWRAALTFALTLLVFFRLRLFDEIKDYASDRTLHPTRPLPRGLITVGRARGAIVKLVALELLCVLPLGAEALGAWLILLAFSVLMYREFFVGTWLRPRMELYAVTHTFVAVLMGMWVVTATVPTFAWTGESIATLGVSNWALFTLFEFARKTYGRDEEKPGRESYSQRLGGVGAVSVSLVLSVLAFCAPWSASQSVVPATPGIIACGILVLALFGAGLRYAMCPQRPQARLFRGITGIFLAGFYLCFSLSY